MASKLVSTFATGKFTRVVPSWNSGVASCGSIRSHGLDVLMHKRWNSTHASFENFMCGSACDIAQRQDELPKSFYRRPLPGNLIPFGSTTGKQIFREALDQGYMEGYFAIAEQFHTQSEPAFCALASLSMCLNSLNIDPNRLWKGPWRWFAEDMLDCCAPIEVVKKRGVTFTEFGCLARCNGAAVNSHRADQTTLEGFREAIKNVCKHDAERIVVSYSRKVLGQTGEGHFSPVGGYHPDRDLALIMDVARFKYTPHWVPVELLWKAMFPVDEATKCPRGYFVLRKSQQKSHMTTFCRVKANPNTWGYAADQFSRVLPAVLAKLQPQTVHEVVRYIFERIPNEVSGMLSTYPKELTGRLSLEHVSLLKELLQQIEQTQMYKIVKEVLSAGNYTFSDHKLTPPPPPNHQSVANSSLGTNGYNWVLGSDHNMELATILLLACPSQVYSSLSLELREKMSELRALDALPLLVRTEVMHVREQMFQLSLNCKCSKVSCPTDNNTTPTPPSPPGCTTTNHAHHNHHHINGAVPPSSPTVNNTNNGTRGQGTGVVYGVA